MPLCSRGHFRYGVERAKHCVNVHWHCIVSNMERISKWSSLLPLEKFLRMPVLLTWIFSSFWHFFDMYWLFLTCKYNKQKYLNYRNFNKPFLCNIQSRDLKLSRPRRDLKPSRLRLAKMGLETSLETETKSRDSITGCWWCHCARRFGQRELAFPYAWKSLLSVACLVFPFPLASAILACM